MDCQALDTQRVGELFVMQYYTQMHKDPQQMYKFYQETSSFVHGGSEIGRGDVVIGRQAIRTKIASLNLEQVHTKIRQVDSHETVPNEVGPCVVVQVTGELSVAGQPMRPFVQTFVLAKEAERKYHIFNDIFRYQLYDDDVETDPDPPRDSDVLSDRPLSKEPRSPSVPDESLYHCNEQGLPLDITADKRSPVPMGSAGHSDVIHEASVGGSWHTDQYEPQSNGLPDEAHVSLSEEPSYPMEDEENTTPIDREVEEEGMVKGEGADNKSAPLPGTWASRISQNIKPAGQVQQQPYYSQTNKPAQVPRGNPLPQREPKQVKKVSERLPEKKPFVPSPSSTRTAPDSHQVFVGGLPSGTSENDLKDLFKQFGKVTEVRVNPKNFGFVVFDNEQSVRDVIAAKEESPLMLRDKRLNIEEKRQSAPKGGMGIGQGLNRKAPLRPSNRVPKRT